MSIWYTTENSNIDKPAEIDKTSSKVYNYIRKDFIEIPAEGTEGEMDFHPAHWQWQEQKVKKSDWDIYEKILGHDDALDDIYAALTELADIVAG